MLPIGRVPFTLHPRPDVSRSQYATPPSVLEKVKRLRGVLGRFQPGAAECRPKMTNVTNKIEVFNGFIDLSPISLPKT
jgi:hypothetical protein